MTDRPLILVLAGVNGAGKSSVIGSMLNDEKLTFFNPDQFAKQLLAVNASLTIEDANAIAWDYGKEKLEAAIKAGENWAFETTLGGNTITRLLIQAAETHDVCVVYCGLDSVDLHIERVSLRVKNGGHDIPEDKIRGRWASSRMNLNKLMPYLTELAVFDNSSSAVLGQEIPDPKLLLLIRGNDLIKPDFENTEVLGQIPDWAKPILMQAADVFKDKSFPKRKK